MVLYSLILFSGLHFGQTWQWAQTPSGEGEGYAIILDLNNNIFITGSSPVLFFGPYSFSSGGTAGVYLAKYNSNGNILWAKGSIGSGSDAGLSLTSDSYGNVYVTGVFTSPTISFDTYTLTNDGTRNIFIVKYDSNGNVLWAKSIKGSGSDWGTGVKSDPGGNVYLTGTFSSPTITFDTYTLTNNGTWNGFITKYDQNGNLLWVNHIGGNGSDGGSAISMDTSGKVFLTGYYSSSPTTFGSYTLTNAGPGQNIFLTKYNPNGTVLWAKNTIGSGDDFSTSICTDPHGNSYIAAVIGSPSMTIGSYSLGSTGGFNVLLAKYDTNGNVLWAKCGNGPYSEVPFSVACDANSVYMTGGLDYTLSFDSQTITAPAGSTDPMFIVRYDGSGNLNYFGAELSGGDDQSGICVDTSCNAFITGDFIGNSFNLGSNTLQGSGGDESIFVGKLSFSCLTSGLSQFTSGTTEQYIFPNPNNGSFVVQIDKEIKNGEITLINATGQNVYRQKIIQGTNNINSSLPFGIYDCILLYNGLKINAGKLMIE